MNNYGYCGWVQAVPALEDRYVEQHVIAQNNLIRIQEILGNMPAPDSGDSITWGHVGSLAELNRQLELAMNFIKGY